MPSTERADASKALAVHLCNFEGFQAARRLFAFAPADSEPDWWADWQPGACRLFLPRVEGIRLAWAEVGSARELVFGAFGLREPPPEAPVPDGPPDLILVPGLAFDSTGGRLGRGRGFYDRALRAFDCPRVGVAFACQLVERVPVDSADLPVDFIATENGVVPCSGGRGNRPPAGAYPQDPP